jgi:hypothetical protein
MAALPPLLHNQNLLPVQAFRLVQIDTLGENEYTREHLVRLMKHLAVKAVGCLTPLFWVGIAGRVRQSKLDKLEIPPTLTQ